MGNDIDRIKRLNTLVAIVGKKLASVPKGDASDIGVRASLHRIEKELTDSHGARFGFAGGAYTMRLGGIGATCTMGTLGLLQGWQNAARRRVEKIRAGAA